MSQKTHFIGIGGIGMSALARILLDKKTLVSGTDLHITDNITHLKQQGAIVKKGHSARYISRETTVVYSSGVSKGNPELIAAKALNCRLIHRSELLAELMTGMRAFACAGTHGKTTTSALLTHVLTEGGLDPTFALGGMVKGLNGKRGSSPFFVAEADESDGSFLNYHVEGAIVTNIEPEHLDHYKSEKALREAFETFFTQVQNKNLLFYCGDALSTVGVSYGFSNHCDLRLSNYAQKGWKGHFDIDFEGKTYRDVVLSMPGTHNALNAAAVFGLSLRLDVKEKAIRAALANFPGIARRCQKRSEQQSVLYLDDYAHHPTEICATVRAVKAAVQERRLVVIFQPHRYTRTRDQLDGYRTAFDGADQVYVTNIYAAGETPIEGIDQARVVEAIRGALPLPDELDLQPHDVVLTLGAGDITHFHLNAPAPKKLKVGLIFGGKSCEHEISLRSARSVASHLNPTLYEIAYFGIDKHGKWLTGAKRCLEIETIVPPNLCRPLSEVMEELEKCDLFLPILHGPNGEDGTLQGLFEILGKPYVGPNYRAAAIAMDKDVTKKVVSTAGVTTPHALCWEKGEWQQRKRELCVKVKHFPVYVKPVHLGSSVGVSYVEEAKELEKAVESAFCYDSRVLIEEGKMGCRELEFAVMGNARPIVAPPGEKLAQGTFVDYEKKYGSDAVQTTVYPDLSDDLIKKGRELAEAAYCAVGGSGMMRVDFLLDAEGTYWFNEMNPIPGLTSLSLFPKIWEREGISFTELLDRLIIYALEEQRCLSGC